MVSALDELDSVVRCIELGAADYLPKPFNPVLLRARINACLAQKRWRDKEVEYLRQMAQVSDAAAAVEANAFDPTSLDAVAARTDGVGQLARVFLRMAREVHAREQRLQLQIERLRLDMEERQKAASETLSIYLPMDRRHALAQGATLPDRAHGAVLDADISGFTPLTETLARELGLQRGAEELTRNLNQVYSALIDEVDRYGGSVIGFSGDAITCWFPTKDEVRPSKEGLGMKDEEQETQDKDNSSSILHLSSLRAVACALAMQTAMRAFATVLTPTGTPVSLAIKVAVVAGDVRRFLVGDAQMRVLEVLAGKMLDELAQVEHQAQRSEVLVGADVATALSEWCVVSAWRVDEHTGLRAAVVSGLTQMVAPAPWPALSADALNEELSRAWLLPSVYERWRSGKGEFLAELRPAVSLFLNFRGIDYDHDETAGDKLDAFVRWVQTVLARYEGSLLQLTMGDKGSYLHAAFGAPIAHEDDAARAVQAALALKTVPADLSFIQHIQIGIAQGQMRVGAYGGTSCRTYGVLGDKANLAARLMQAAPAGDSWCDEAVYQAARAQLDFESLPPIVVKGKQEPVNVYRPLSAPQRAHVTPNQQLIYSRIDQLTPTQQYVLKVASVIGQMFAVHLLYDLLPPETASAQLHADLQSLEQREFITRDKHDNDPTYMFTDPMLHETIYNLLLFAQRRQLHRVVAEWYEQHYTDLSPYYALLAHHWRNADDTARAIDFLEKAGEQARQRGAPQDALRFFTEGLALNEQSAVLSECYYTDRLNLVKGSDPSQG
jgi:class 3 adenylate cyclase